MVWRIGRYWWKRKRRSSSPRFLFECRLISLLREEVERDVQSHADWIIVFHGRLVLEVLRRFDRALVETGTQSLLDLRLRDIALFVDDDADDDFTGNLLLLRLVRISRSRSFKQTWSCDLVGQFVNLLRSRLCRQHAYGGHEHQSQNDEDFFHNAPSRGSSPADLTLFHTFMEAASVMPLTSMWIRPVP